MLTNVCRVFVINCQTSFYQCRKLDFLLSSLQIRRRSAPFNVYKTCVVYLSTLRFHQGSDRFPGSQRQKQKTTLSAWSVLSRPLAVPPPHVCRRLETGLSRLVRTRSRTWAILMRVSRSAEQPANSSGEINGRLSLVCKKKFCREESVTERMTFHMQFPDMYRFVPSEETNNR